MGVKGYQSWIRLTYRHLVKDKLFALIRDDKVRRLFLDLNAIIHMAIDETYEIEDVSVKAEMKKDPVSFWDESISVLAEEIILLILITRPYYLVYLAADGAVSKAKIVQQRQRTYKSSSGSGVFNRNNVKPGTEYMSRLSSQLRTVLIKRLNNLQNTIDDLKKKLAKDPEDTYLSEILVGLEESKYRGPGKLMFSDACKKGEGEHKIIRAMREERPKKGAGNFARMVDVVFSPDADMHILTMLNATLEDNVVIMRQKHKHKKPREDEPKSRYARYEYFHVTKIRDALKAQGVFSMQDFAVISCFGGNDFVPALSYFKYGDGNTFQTIVSAFISTFPNRKEPVIYKDGKIQWQNVLRFLRTLSERSEESMRRMGILQIEDPSRFVNEKTGEDRRFPDLIRAMKLFPPNPPKYPEKRYTFHGDFFDSQYNKYISRTHHATEKEDMDFGFLPEMCKNYLEGIVWVLEYYRQEGKTVNQNWAYTFHYPPNPEDLYKFLEDNIRTPDLWSLRPTYIGDVENPDPPFEPMEQLMAVLKKEDLNLVPEIARILFLEKLPSLYPEKVLVDLTFIRFEDEHDGIALTNFPDMDRIRSLYSTIADDPIVAARNKNNLKLEVWSLKAEKSK